MKMRRRLAEERIAALLFVERKSKKQKEIQVREIAHGAPVSPSIEVEDDDREGLERVLSSGGNRRPSTLDRRTAKRSGIRAPWLGIGTIGR